MTGEIRRETSHPSHLLPLPSGITEERREIVDDLISLWREIYSEKLHKHKPEEVREKIHAFFEELDSETMEWLQGGDWEQGGKPRALLIKQRAIQEQQIAETPVKKRHRQERD